MPDFISMTEETTNNKTCGYMYRCCWPCTCDSMKYAKTMNISHKFKGIEEQFTVMTIDNPCGKEEFPLEVNRDYFCNGSDLLAINSHPVVGEQCKIRNSAKEEELISGMGDIFIKLSK